MIIQYKKKFSVKSIFLFIFIFLCTTNFFQIVSLHTQYYWVLSGLILIFISLNFVTTPNFKVEKNLLFLILANILVLIYHLTSSISLQAIYEAYSILIPPLFGFYLGKKITLRLFIYTLFFCWFLVLSLNFSYYFFSPDVVKGFSGFLPNANRLGALSSLVSLIFFLIYYYTREKKFIVISLFSFIMLFLTSHRAGILALFLSVIIFLFQCVKIKNFIFLFKKYFLKFSLLIIISLLILPTSNIYKKSFKSESFEISKIRDSGRLGTWSIIVGNLKNEFDNHKYFKLIVGTGLVVSTHDGWRGDWQQEDFEVPHNEYLRLLMEIGFLGLFIYLFLIYRIILPKPRVGELEINVRFINLGIPLFIHYIILFGFTNMLYHSYSYTIILFLFVGALKGNNYRFNY